MRCIETGIVPDIRFILADKLQHEMYWNEFSSVILGNIGRDKLQHEMYWNLTKPLAFCKKSAINYNMRCIETESNAYTEGEAFR